MEGVWSRTPGYVGSSTLALRVTRRRTGVVRSGSIAGGIGLQCRKATQMVAETV